MKKQKLIVMCGCPASGKSSYIQEHFNGGEYEIVSRDQIRFTFLQSQKEADYFEFEAEVYQEFIERINEGLRGNKHVVADATHLNERSRIKLLNCIDDIDNYELVYVCMETPLKVCLERNEQREGYAKVPRGSLRRMYFSYARPTRDERYKYDELIVVSESEVNYGSLGDE